MKQISRGDLKYFSAHALTGLLANPFLVSVEGRRYLDMKNMTIERLAINSALELLEKLHIVEASLDHSEALIKEEEEKQEKEPQ